MRHLLSHAHFDAVMTGRPVLKTAHFALHVGGNPLPALAKADVAVGVVLPKRWAKSAVRRNAIRRSIYRVALEKSGAQASVNSAAWVIRLHTAFDAKLHHSPSSSGLCARVDSELRDLLGVAAALGVKGAQR